jgi:hypothetical protein
MKIVVIKLRIKNEIGVLLSEIWLGLFNGGNKKIGT